jgi:hypothetical protein
MSSRAYRVQVTLREAAMRGYRASQARFVAGVGVGRGIVCRAHSIAHDPEKGRVCPLCYAADAVHRLCGLP